MLSYCNLCSSRYLELDINILVKVNDRFIIILSKNFYYTRMQYLLGKMPFNDQNVCNNVAHNTRGISIIIIL